MCNNVMNARVLAQISRVRTAARGYCQEMFQAEKFFHQTSITALVRPLLRASLTRFHYEAE